MARYCSACGMEVILDAASCHRCGQRLTGDDPGAESAGPAVHADSGEPATDAGPARGGGLLPRHSEASPESETRLWQGGYGYRALIPLWMLAACATLLAGAAAIFFQGLWSGLFVTLILAVVFLGGVGLYAAYCRLSVHYELTSQRFVHQAGLLRRTSTRIDMIDIDDVAFGQGPMERILGIGTIKLVSSDRSHPELIMPGIEDVKEVATLIDDARRADRRRRGLYIEGV